MSGPPLWEPIYPGALVFVIKRLLTFSPHYLTTHKLTENAAIVEPRLLCQDLSPPPHLTTIGWFYRKGGGGDFRPVPAFVSITGNITQREGQHTNTIAK